MKNSIKSIALCFFVATSFLLTSCSSDDDNSISTIQLQEVLDKVSSDKIVQEVSVVKVDSDEPDKSSNGAKQPGLTKLKVTDLKDLVLNDNLASPSKVAEMKKKELIELLRTK